MRNLSFIDELTGMRNRRGFFLLAQRRIDAARQVSATATVVTVVIESLKETNDWHGRAAGAELIRDAARALTTAFGPDDVIARLGGGEFAVLTTGPPEGMRAEIQKAAQNRQSLVADRPYKLILSVGVVSSPIEDETTLDELIAAADADLHAHRGEAPAGPPPVRTQDRAKSPASKRSGSQAAA